jgi:hypothetical protein
MQKTEDDEFYPFFQTMHHGQIMLTYKGSINFELVDSFLSSIESKINFLEENVRTRKTVMNVLVECLQNSVHHSDSIPVSAENIEPEKLTLLLVTTNKSGYRIYTGNPVRNEKVAGLREWLEKINLLSPEELREAYIKVLDNGEFSEKGTAGLGFIDIARKTGQKLEYSFADVDNNFSIFSYVINVPRRR